MTQDAALAVEGLTVGYRRRGQVLGVLEDVSFAIGRGEAYGLVGESGCGKSTVAMALMRYLPRNALVSAGTARFDGQDLLSAPDSTLRSLRGDRIAMVYQDPGSALNPTMRVGAQVAEVYTEHRSMSSDAALDASREMLGRVRISDPAGAGERYPHELSGGQQQRVMIAMALATDPELLILDEPTTGLDATVEAEVLDLVEALRSEFAAAVLFISHNLGIISRLCDRVGVLYAGRLIEEAPASELFASPGHPYTAGLLRCLPRLGMRKDTDPLAPIGGAPPAPGEQPPACVYVDRCPIARPVCAEQAPPPAPVGPLHMARCHFSEEAPALAAAPVRAPAVSAPAGGRTGDVLLRVEHAAKTYSANGRSVTAVDDVSLEICRGEVFGLVGESGSGKTTLAKAIADIVALDEGTITLEGGERTPDRLQMVFQNPDGALNPRHTIGRTLRRAVGLLAGVRGRAAQDARVSELVGLVRLEARHLEVRPAALSGGMKQRVGIARAFAGTPSLVLCDEPVSALDVSVQAAILNLLADLQREQDVAYLFISHDLAVVRYLSDTIGVMYLGQLVDVGPAEDVFRPPHHPYTEALLSAVPDVDGTSGRERIVLRDAQPSPADPPSGCRFHTRCPRRIDGLCEVAAPPWHREAGGHAYRCHIAPDDLRTAQRDPRAEGDRA